MIVTYGETKISVIWKIVFVGFNVLLGYPGRHPLVMGILSRRDPLWVCRLFFCLFVVFFFRHTFIMFSGHLL